MGISLNATVKEVLQNHRRRRHRSTLLSKVEDDNDVLKGLASQADDIAKWKCRSDVYKPRFKSKDTWLLIQEVHLRCDWHELTWFKNSTPKFSFFFWTVMHDCIQTALVKGILKENYTTAWDAVFHNIKRLAPDKTALFVAKYALQATMYSLWRERNARKHGEESSPPLRVIKTLDKAIRNRLSTIRLQGKEFENALVYWFSTRN
ncbi:uncharacterized protein LOC112084405 [Eutrema salsugineum]|uniref:uncharacterized protein LOC112084405 n=1 Tax=Eutrema salsugineum TaxID=72664 RepID=UPI000CECE673|nr:uncharacterized protein LOC112084405 [Eutrema salsugineum]